MRKLLIFLTILLPSTKLFAAENYYVISNKNVYVVVDECKKDISIHKLTMDTDVLGGHMTYSLNGVYDIPILKKDKSKEGLIIYTGSDFSEGSGINAKITITNSDDKLGSIIFKIQDEESGIFYNPQLMKVITKIQDCTGISGHP